MLKKQAQNFVLRLFFVWDDMKIDYVSTMIKDYNL